MSIKGGYKIIDFRGINLEPGTPVVIPGVWEAIESNYRKPTLLSGLVVGGVEKNDVYVEFVVTSSEYTANIVGGSLTVNDADNVTYTAAS